MSNFNYIAEVPIYIADTLEIVLEKATKLLGLGFNTLAFPDRARAESNVASIQELLKLGIFEKLPKDKILPIIATRTKLPEELDEIVKNLKSIGINNLFIVTGDPHKSSRANFLTSLDVLPNLSKQFSIGAAVHADTTALDRDIKKIDAGAKFLIVQACYDQNKWMKWIAEASKQGLNKKVSIYQVVIPLTNKAILENMHAIHDVSLPNDLYNELCTYDENALRDYGVTNAISQINQVKQNSFFSGVYMYSRDFEVLTSIFNYHAPEKL